ATFRPRVCVSSSLKLWKISISPNSEEIHRQPPGGHKCLLKSSPAIQPRLPPDLPRSRAGRYPHTARVRLPPRRSLPLPYTDLRVTLARRLEHRPYRPLPCPGFPRERYRRGRRASPVLFGTS